MDAASPTAPTPTNPPDRPIWKEGLLGCVVAALLAAVAVPGVRTRPEVPIDVPSIARLAKLVELARDEATETGDDHIIFLDVPNGREPGPQVLLFRDMDGNSEPSEVEVIGRYPIAPARWGRAVAAERAIGDAGVGLRGPWAFEVASLPAAMGELPGEVENANAKPATPVAPSARAGVRGVVFDSAGVPHRIDASGLRAAPGSGAGSLYLRTNERDYAVVISPWGDVDVQLWDAEAAHWRFAIAP